MIEGSLARRLRVLRAERGMTQEMAAKVIGITPLTLSGLERGKRRPYSPTLEKIAKGYGVPIEDLVVEEEPQTPEPPTESENTLESPQGKRWLREHHMHRFAATDVEYLHEYVDPAREGGEDGLLAEYAVLAHEYEVATNALPTAPSSAFAHELQIAWWRKSRLIRTEFERLVKARLTAPKDEEPPTDAQVVDWYEKFEEGASEIRRGVVGVG